MVRESFFWGKESSDSWGDGHFVMWKVELSLIISHTDKTIYWKLKKGKIKEEHFSKQGSMKEFEVKQKV